MKVSTIELSKQEKVSEFSFFELGRKLTLALVTYDRPCS